MRASTLSEKKSSKKPSAPPSASLPGSPMDVALLQQIVSLMATNDLNTVDVRDGNRRIILKRGSEPVAPLPTTAPPPAHPGSPQSPPADDANLKSIPSPMVGTFYTAPSPDAKPFVSVGSPVDEDTDVCIIEAMKVFNNIKAECHGTIAKTLVQNGQPVEFGQTLFLVKPA
jgi:acetyl-CoA carboxylase biotin carboxyl carrier protein